MVKASGGALAGSDGWGVDATAVNRMAADVVAAAERAEVAVVVGGGNFLRGRDAEALGIDRVEADNVGMLGTAMNALLLRGAIRASADVDVRVMSALPMQAVAEPYIRLRAVRHLEKGRIVVLACGIGQPFVTTDYPSVQRAVELDADMLLAAKQGVDAVYDRDPHRNPDATRLERLTHDEAIERQLTVLDPAAFLLARDHGLAIRVFGSDVDDALRRIVDGEDLGTLITSGER